jgi:hypothetical protein
MTPAALKSRMIQARSRIAESVGVLAVALDICPERSVIAPGLLRDPELRAMVDLENVASVLETVVEKLAARLLDPESEDDHGETRPTSNATRRRVAAA